MIAVVERELSVPPQVWQGYRLLDRPEVEDAAETVKLAEDASRNLEHVFSLLSTIVAREPLDAAVHGVRSANPGVRGLAIEYLDQVLPPADPGAAARRSIAATPSAGDAPVAIWRATHSHTTVKPTLMPANAEVRQPDHLPETRRSRPRRHRRCA